MLEDLDKLILFINQEYREFCKKWKSSDLYIQVNQKNKLVKDIKDDDNILNSILNYRSLINEIHLDLKIAVNKLNLTTVVNSRVKTLNSIEYKIKNYLSEKHNNGENPINKCFNDLYGVRIILNNSTDYNTIKEFVENRYDGKLKCIDSSKGEYVATHIYFKQDNYCYQWELQVWDKEHEKSNIISHEKYKQDYTKWEKENKGGGVL